MRSEDPDRPHNFLHEETEEERFEARGLLFRWAVGFVLLFGGVFLAFWWSGSAIRFGAARLTASNIPTYRVWGAVRDAKSGEPIPWVTIEDDPAGDPPYFRTEADQDGVYSLVTLAEPHNIRISANSYRTATLHIGKPWFVWWPRGEERHEIRLSPE